MSTSHLTSGNLKKTGKSFDLRFLELDHVQGMLDLQHKVQKITPDRAILEPLSEEEFINILSGNGYMVGTFVEGELIAFRAMLVPSIDDVEHLGYDAGLMKEELHKVIYSEISVVHPQFRGNGLQTYMGKMVFRQIDQEKFSYVAATVAPGNIPSMKDKFSLHMEIVNLKEKYDGKLRYIFFHRLNEHKQTDTSTPEIIDIGAIEMQQKLLQIGYRGTAVEKGTDHTFNVMYKK